jgi:hypothetical protein
MSDQPARAASQRYLYRNYLNADESFAPYRNMLHTLTDEFVTQASVLESLFEAAGVRDGDEIEIVVRVAGGGPFPNRIWKLTKPHTYEPVDR